MREKWGVAVKRGPAVPRKPITNAAMNPSIMSRACITPG